MALNEFSRGDSTPDISDRFEADIIVVGLGFAGIAAVRAARETGADVIGLDRRPCTALPLSGRNFEHINSFFLDAHGVPRVDTEAIMAAWPEGAGDDERFASIRSWLTGSGEAFDWFTEHLSPAERAALTVYEYPGESRQELPPPPMGSGDVRLTAARFPAPNERGGVSLTACAIANLYAAEEQGASFFFSTEPLRWIEAGEHVCGVAARQKNGAQYRFTARQGVILCVDLPMDHTPQKTHVLSVPGRHEITRGNFFAGTIHTRESPEDIGVGMAVTLGRAYGLAAARDRDVF